MPKIVAEKEDWIKLGFESFASHGASAIVVDKMASKLKCNRSSFYWHFSSKENFIDEILNYWIDADTNQIIAQVERGRNPKEKFRLLVKITFKADPYIDFIFHLKRYAIKRKDIQKIIDDIDDQRIAYVAALLEENGYEKEEALIKAGLFYKYLIGYHEMIKYKKQPRNYVEGVFQELNHFIEL